MRKLNILIFDGSTKKTTFVNRLIAGLVQRGHKVTMAEFHSDVTKRIPEVEYKNLGSQSKKLKLILSSLMLLIQTVFKTSFLSRFTRLVKGFLTSDIPAIRKVNFLNTVLKTKPDIVHLQWLSLLPLSEEVIEKGLAKIVLSQRGTHINVRPFVNGRNFNYLRKWFSKIDGFHSVSKAIQHKSNLIYTSEDKIDMVVYSGLDIENVEFNKNYSKAGRLNLLSVGRPHWIKGYASMIQVCAKLKEAGTDFKYTIVGVDSNEEELIYLIAHYQLENEVILKSKITQSNVFELMKASSVLILPSLEEGIANVAIEAMAIGLPVISTDCGGMSELIEDNKTGWLVPLHNANAFVNTIVKFHQTGIKEIDTLRLEARKKVESQNSIDKMIIDMENLYFKCLA